MNVIDVTSDPSREKLKLQHQLFKTYEAHHEIKSAPIQQMTSANLADLKTLLIASSNAFEETSALIETAQSTTEGISRRLTSTQKSIFRFLFKKRILRLQTELDVSEEQLAELRQQRDLTVVQLDIDTEDVFFQMYQLVGKSFQLLKSSEKKWDMTSSRETNRIAERTSATSTITRSSVDLAEGPLPILRTKDTCLCIHNINGGDLYFYPDFMIVYDSKTDFALIDYADLTISYASQRFIE
ncbi:MAG: hypothetical protein JNK79_12235 [Chitinophagaceae bacterium]|nr:hypothetical protein [Chitinophagaceae bacterium]